MPSSEGGEGKNPHFANAESWQAAREMLTFSPREIPTDSGFELLSLNIHIRDHKHRDLAIIDRSLEASYDGFSLSQQACSDDSEARRQALQVSYGRQPIKGQIGGHEARIYELGPEPEPDDIDPRMPAVVTWSDGRMFYLLASGEMQASALVPIAETLY